MSWENRLLRAAMRMKWQYDDGGRATAGFRGHAGDCVVRAIAIASQMPYRDVYGALRRKQKDFLAEDDRWTPSPRYGVHVDVYEPFLESVGWTKVEMDWMYETYLQPGFFPPRGRYIAQLNEHVVAVVNGVLRDTHNPLRNGILLTVRSYWHKS